MARSYRKEDCRLPHFVCNWTNFKHLDMLSVCYAPNALKDPNDIFEKLNKPMKSKRQIPTLPERMECVKEFLNEYVNFSIVDDENSLRTDQEITRKYIKEIEECMIRLSSLNIFEYIQSKGIHEHELELKRLLIKVYVKSHDFLEMVIKFLKLMWMPTGPFEGAYTELIRVFSDMCDLTSVPGDTIRRLLTLKDEAVLCKPDIRYFLEAPTTSTSDLNDLLVLMIAERKRDSKGEIREEKDFNIVMEVHDKVLGQHGGELIVESPFSVFKPYMLGALSLKTELIFTILEMDLQHFDKLVCDEDLTSEKAYIYYTKPYNFMIAKEREMLLDLLLRLSLFQRRNH